MKKLKEQKDNKQIIFGYSTILANKKQSAEQQVNSIGKFLYKNIDSAYNFRKSTQQFDLYIIVLYEVPKDIIDGYNLDESYDELYEMKININLTTYQNKLRINFIELDPEEATIGHKTYNLDRYKDYYELRDNIVNYLLACLDKRYEGYDFIF